MRGLIVSTGENMRAIVILIHGLGEHIQRYDHWSEMFSKAGIGFTGVDLPGHGRSDGARGHIKSYRITDEILKILIEETGKTFPGTPLFLYGHSLGGGIVLDYILRKQPSIKGAIVTSPWIKLAFEPDRFKLLLASVMKNIIPGLVQPSKLIVDHLSHDPAVVARYISDPLVHDKISVGLFHSAMTAAARTLTHANEVIVPILLVHGSNDMICSPEGSRIFALNSEKVELKIWEGGYHELHNEPFKKEVFGYIMTWLSNHI